MALVASVLVGAAGGAVAAEPAFSTSADAIWMTNGTGKVLALASASSRVFIGGSFTAMRPTYNGTDVNQPYVAAVDLWSGELLTAFDPQVDDEVRAVATSPDGQTVYIGGRFTQVNGKTRTRVAALNVTNGNLRPGWIVEIPSGAVNALAVDSQGDVYIGGNFHIVDNQGQRSLAKLDGATGDLLSWDANIPEGRVKSLLLSPDESRLYVGTEILDENNRPNLGAFFAVDPSDGAPIPGFDASAVNRPVLDISATPQKIYLALGGGGGAADILQASDGSRRRRFYTDGDVQGVQVVGDRAYFGGHWVENFGQHESFHFIAVELSGDEVDDSYNPVLNGAGGLHDFLYDGYHLWMGGHITNGSPVAVRGFARFAPVGGGAPLTPLIGSGATWTYLDDGSRLGTRWRRLNYSDRSWRTGDAELGYGDGDEKTVVRSGPDGNRHITTYFRRHFAVYDHSRISRLEIELKRDDGAVVYINGQEVIRDNMPAGTVRGRTLAVSDINGAAEDEFNRWILSPDVLVDGDNIVAVEIHQVAPTSNDISFDLRLLVDASPTTFVGSGAIWRYRDDGPSLGTAWRRRGFDDSSWRRGPAQLGYGEGDEARVIRRGPPGDRHITSYFRRVFTVYDHRAVATLELELLRDDGAVVYLNQVEVARSNMPSGLINSEVRSATIASPPGEQDWYRFSLDPALLVEGDNVLAVEIHQSGPRSGDHSFDARLALQATPETLIARDGRWRYHDGGSGKGVKWRKRRYPAHNNWKRGNAELGYGDGDEVTVVDSGPPGDHHPTIYFRRKFAVTDPTVFSTLDLGLVRDDGAVVYINGVEVVRDNMPAGRITYATWAEGSASGEDEFHRFTVPASMLLPGVNVVAVEIHQAGPGSSDLSFNLELIGR